MVIVRFVYFVGIVENHGLSFLFTLIRGGGVCGHDCMVIGFTTTKAISAYHH